MRRNELTAFLALWAFALAGGAGMGAGGVAGNVWLGMGGGGFAVFALMLALGGYWTRR